MLSSNDRKVIAGALIFIIECLMVLVGIKRLGSRGDAANVGNNVQSGLANWANEEESESDDVYLG